MRLIICSYACSYVATVKYFNTEFDSAYQRSTESALKCNFRTSTFKNFPGGMPPDLLAIVARMLALHADYASHQLAT